MIARPATRRLLGLLTLSAVRAFSSTMPTLGVTTWNVAAVNNNPFEYWITSTNPRYNTLMNNVEAFIKSPTIEQDITVNALFNGGSAIHALFDRMQRVWPKADVDLVYEIYNKDFADRKIVSEFLKDAEIGSKRLASMPDRMTNTIRLKKGLSALRPTVINCCVSEFTNFDDFTNKWLRFFFDFKLEAFGPTYKVHSLLTEISSSKYPALSAEEERLSLPLQTMALFIFDSILVHMMNELDAEWQDMRQEMCMSLNLRKAETIKSILTSTYLPRSDIACLQEVASSFESDDEMDENYFLIKPIGDIKRDQLSAIFLKKSTWDLTTIEDLTSLVMSKLPEKTPVSPGDLLVIRATHLFTHKKFLIASFHGDTNGLATIPALGAFMQVRGADEHVIFGMDANAYIKQSHKLLNVKDFEIFFKSSGLLSTWSDDMLDVNKILTTYNARTYLQPQLNKACSRDDFIEKGDVNPKDFILYDIGGFVVDSTIKDNTGEMSYNEDTPFPTAQFPSDHGVVHSIMRFAQCEADERA